MPAYDRNSAIDYAKKFWDRPCDDGVFWLTNGAVDVARKRHELDASSADGWEPRFVPDGRGREQAVFTRKVGSTVETKVIHEWEGLADCAHFLSKCLTAGGVRLALLSVPKLVADLESRPDTKTLGEKVSQVAGQRIVDSGVFKPGDMIGYFNINPQGDYGGKKEYSHSTMYAGKLAAPNDPGHVTCHTKSRFPGLSAFEDEWFLDPGSYLYTFIHVASDDTPSVPGSALPGWWKVQYGADTFYYYLFADGRARWLRRAPRSVNEQPHSFEGGGYWFMQSGSIAITWRKTGSVESWTPIARTKSARAVLNDTTNGSASSLF